MIYSFLYFVLRSLFSIWKATRLIFIKPGNRKRIALFAEFGEWGGTKSYFYSLCKFYSKTNYEVIAFLKASQFSDEVKFTLKKYDIAYVILSPFEVPKPLFFLNHYLPYLSIITPIVKSYYKYLPDLIFISSGGSEIALFSFLLPVRNIFVLHTYPLCSIHKFYTKIINKSLGKEKKIISVSEFSKNKLTSIWGVDNINPTDVIHNTIYENASNNSIAQPKKEKQQGELIILTSGSVNEYKNPEGWLKIARGIIAKHENQVKFIWIGEGELLEHYKNATVNDPAIVFQGKITNTSGFYSMADIYFQPSLIENHSISLLEAMAYGLPSVVSNAGGMRESIEDGLEGYIVEPNNTEEFIIKINNLISDPRLRIEMGKRAYKTYINKFSNKNWENEMLLLHNTILHIKK